MKRFIISLYVQRRFWAVCLAILMPISATAQPLRLDDEKSAQLRYGIFMGGGFHLQTADFINLPSVVLYSPAVSPRTAPATFRSGSGMGFRVGGRIEAPISSSWALLLNGYYQQERGELRTVERYPIRLQTGDIVNSGSEYRLLSTLQRLGLDVGLGWRTGALNIYGGASAGLNSSAQINAGEYLLNPEFAGFSPDVSLPERNVINTELAELQKLTFAGFLGIGFDVILSRSFTVQPFIQAQAGFTPLVAGVPWRSHSIYAGLVFFITPERSQKPLPPPPAPIEAKPAPPRIDVTAAGVHHHNEEQPVVQLFVKNVYAQSIRPVLPYLFFDEERETRIPARYVLLPPEKTASFRSAALHDEPDFVARRHPYYQILNIVGERLRRYPAASLTITGTTDGAGSEKNDSELARTRAYRVRSYLSEVWGISPSRLLVEARTLPAKPSLPLGDEEKRQENRRVEFSSDMPEILAPVQLFDTVRTVTPPTVRVRVVVPESMRETSIRRWCVMFRQQEREVRRLCGESVLPPAINWFITEAELQHLTPEIPLVYSADVWDAQGVVHQSIEREIPVEYVQTRVTAEISPVLRDATTNNITLSRFSLILFDFAKSSLPANSAGIIEQIKAQVQNNDKVVITGFSDRTGNEEFNQKLSLERARAVAKVLGFPDMTVQGLGASFTLYNNTLPEGRFYSRTVAITVEQAERAK